MMETALDECGIHNSQPLHLRALVMLNRPVMSHIRVAWLQQVKSGRMDFNDFLNRGLVEYVDVNEENNSLIALYEADITPQVRVEPCSAAHEYGWL
jgi:RNA polymerase Rpb2, domain 5